MYRVDLFHPKDPKFQAFSAFGDSHYRQKEPEYLSGDVQCLLLWHDSQPVARTTLRLVEGLHGTNGVVGVLGQYEAAHVGAGVALLEEATERLMNRGAQLVVGPMDGTLWHRFGLVTRDSHPDHPGNHPFFLGEPRNLEGYPEQFEGAGFSVVDSYQSRKTILQGERSLGIQAIEEQLEADGVVIKPLDMGRYEQQLYAIYELCLDALAGNLFYCPIDFQEFKSLYEPLQKYLDPELVLMAWKTENSLEGFAFAYPGSYPGEEQSTNRLILKSSAGRHGIEGIDLGHVLLDQLHMSAYEKGYDEVIHAVIHDDEEALQLSKAMGSTALREYMVYGRFR